MKFDSGSAFLASAPKRLAFIGMSGVGKSTLASYLNPARWTKFCTDFALADGPLRPDLEAFAGTNFPVGPDDISVLSAYVGKLGRAESGGQSVAEFRRRQDLHRAAERQTFEQLVGQLNAHDGPAIIDAGGSLVEILDFEQPDPLLDALCEQALFVYIEADETLEEEVIARQLKAPKPMYYHPGFLSAALADFGQDPNVMEPDAFIRFVFPRLMAHRRPRYAALAARGGVRIPFAAANCVRSDAALLDLIAEHIDHAH